MKIINKILAYIFIIPVKIYQFAISPFLPNSCRHIPSCSQYTIEALRIHGIFRGTWLSINRILRCNPYGTEGYDPVPPQMKRQEWKKFKRASKMGFNPKNKFFEKDNLSNNK